MKNKLNKVYIQLVSMILLFGISNSFAQNNGKNYLFDNNCLPLAKKNRLIRGKPEYLNQIGKRTERWFDWDKITGKYKNLVESKEVSQAAIDRYKNYDPINPPESILSCKDSSGKLESCLAFNAYCTEQLSIVGMKEELTEWRDRVQNCKNPKYIANFPDHCQRDFVRSLNYLAKNAKVISRIVKSKSPLVAKYFQEAQKSFGEFANELNGLKIAQDDARKIDDLNTKRKKDQQVAVEALRSCDELIKKDDRDVKERNITGGILQGMEGISCKAANETGVNSKVQSSLIKDLKSLSRYTVAQEIAPELNKVAIFKSSKALWSTFETFFNKDNISLNKDNEDLALELICKKGSQFSYLKTTRKLKSLCTKKFKELLKKAYSEYLELKKVYPIKKVSKVDLELERELNFNPRIENINKSCKAVRDIEETYACVDRNKMANLSKIINKNSQRKFAITKIPLRLQQIYDDGSPMDINKCNRIIDEKYKALRSIQSKVERPTQIEYAKLVQSRMGHLLVTNDFRKKVGLLPNDWFLKKCRDLRGDAVLLKKVSKEDVEKGMEDFLDLNYKELYDNATEKNSDEKSIDKVKNYLKNNPLTVAELLKRSPSEDYAKALCGFIRDINTSDFRRQWARQGATAVGVVAGVALSFTGVGTPLGLGLLSAVGASTTYEIISINKELKEEKAAIKKQQQAAVTFQNSYQDAVSKIQNSEENIELLDKSKKMTIVFGALEVVGSGGIKLIRNFLRTRRGISAGKILGISSEALTKVKASEFARKMSLNIERITRRTSKSFKKLFNQLEHEEMLELAAVYSKMGKETKKLFLEKLSLFESTTDLKKFIHAIDGNSETSRLFALLDDAKSIKLADGTVIKGLPHNIAGKVSPVSSKAGDITSVNLGVVEPKSFMKKRVASYSKKLNKLEDLSSMVDEIPISSVEKNNLFSHLSFLNPSNDKKLLSILSDSKNVKKSFLEKLNKSGCLTQSYTTKCGKVIQDIIDKASLKPASEHRLGKKWLSKQSPELQSILERENISGGDLFLAKKYFPKETIIKNIDEGKAFMDYLTTLPEAKKIEGFKGLNLVLDGSKLPKTSVFRKYKQRSRIFNNYEKYFYKKVKFTSPKKLKKIAAEKGIAPTKANLDEIAKTEAKAMKSRFMSKFNACKAGNAKGVQAANLKRFLKFNTASSLFVTTLSYFAIMGNDDKGEVKVDKDGNLLEGKPDKDFTSLVSVLGYELVSSYVFSRIPKLVMANPGGDIFTKSTKEFALGGGLDFINTRIFGSIFGVNESESKKKLKEMMNDPTKREALDKLKAYVDKKMKTEKMQKVTQELQSNFSTFTKGLESEDGIGYDYLMDNFSAKDLASSGEILEAFEDSYNEFEYDQKSGSIPLSKYINKLTGGSSKVSLENDLFYYNLGYNIPSAAKRVFMYGLIANRICMGRWGEVLAFTIMDKFLSNAAYWSGRKMTVGQVD